MPGERTPWNVPMMPLADIVALSGSVSNHWSRKSDALIVMSCTKTCCCSAGRRPKSRARPARGRKPRGSRPVGSAGTIDRMGLMKRAISTISRPYDS